MLFPPLKRISITLLSRKWLLVYGYLLIILIATPYLPSLIEWAQNKWPTGSVSGLVLIVEISIGFLLIALVCSTFFFNRRKFFLFILIASGLIVVSCLFYLIIRNPYELTHLPEYALLSILILQAIEREKKQERGKVNKGNSYVESAIITGIFGGIDEIYQGLLPLRYFNWYDILLNMIGGLLGLTIFWGIIRD